MTTPQEQFWAGDFGASYIQRNRVDWERRVPFWDDIINWVSPSSVLEVGCNIGSNLKAIRSISRDIQLVGVDVNDEAISEAAASGLAAYRMSATEVGITWPDTFDLVATVGVLIHVAPESLSGVMDAIIAASKRYVLAVEYAADTEEHVDYRGHAQRLWRRPFGKLYENKGLKLIETGDAGEGFDRCTYYLLERA